MAFSALSLFCDLLTCSGKCWLCGKSDHVAAGLTVQQSKCLALLLGGLWFQEFHEAARAMRSEGFHQILQKLWGPWWSIVEPCGTRVESLQSFVEPCETSGPTALAESCGTLKPSYNLTSNHPGPPRSLEPCWNGTLPCKTWWNSGGILVEHCLKPARTGETLVEPSWNLPGPRRTPEEIGGTLVEPSSTARRAGGTLVETWWNPRGTLPQTTSDHPAALAEPGETLAESWWKSGGTLVEPSSNQTTPALEEIAGTLVEPSWNLTSNHPDHPAAWNPGGTLAEPS